MTTASIFIIEDEIITAKSIAKNLKNLGYQVAGIATTGSKAIATIIQLKPDLILMDILLKKDDIDGITTAQKIKEQIDIPVVYLTAHSDEATLERAKLTTPFGYIIKPYSKKDLQVTIKMALYKHSQEAKLLEREQLFSKILNSTKEGIIAASNSNKITYINPAAEELTGYTIDETIGQNTVKVINFFDIKNNTPIPNPIKQVLQKGEVIYLDNNVALIAKNGNKIAIKDSVAPILKQSTNEIEGAVLIFSPDNTSLLFDNKTLEPKPNKVLETPAIQTRFEALSNNLFNLISHELRTPLAVILSTSESLRRYRQRWTVEKQNSSFDKIQKAVEQINQLLEDINVWQQAGEGLFFQPIQVDLIDFCEEILSSLPLLNCNHQLIFSPQLKERIAFIDSKLLKYAIQNILLNAVKYSPQHSVISFTITTQEDNSLLFKVQDRGIGIPDREQSSLFDSFYRGSNVGNIPGTGLGLAIAKRCVELHQGSIHVESQINAGTIFSIVIPAI